MNTKSGRNLKEGKKQYLFTMTLTFLAMLIMVSYMFVSYFSIIKQDAVSIGEKTVLEETEKINNFISKSKNVLQITSLTIEYMMQNNATDEDIKDYLLIESEKYTTEVDKNFTGIYGVFRGKYIDGINWQWEEGFEPERRPWYIKAKEAGGNIAIVSPYKDKQTGRILISVCKMLADGESIIAIDIYLDEIHNIVKSLKVNGNGFGFIFDETGMIVAHCDEKYNGSMLDDNYTDGDITGEAGHIALTGNENLYKKTIGGTEYAIFTKSLENNWNIVMVVEYNVWFGQVKNVLIISVLIAIIILISVSYFCLDSLKNRQRSVEYAHELEEYQSSLENRVKAQTDEICKHINTMILLQENMIESMAMLIEGRDGNTGEHIFNTKTYVMMILEYMHKNKLHSDVIDEKYVKNVSKAAVLHDVGKIQISDVILNKPGRFNPEEYEIMKTHAEKGGIIVKEIFRNLGDEELVKTAEEIAKYHHEKWDGTGYPEKLSGEDIPLCARIMAVADVFDALTSKRVYKEKLTAEEAFSILQNDSGKHFDPEIIDVFFKIRPAVEDYLNKKEDNSENGESERK